MPAELVIRSFPAPAINCYTGSLVKLADLYGLLTEEATVLERGDGYLLRAGWDEWRYPEITFDVEKCGMRGMAALGGSVRTEPIEEADPAGQVRTLLARHKGVVAWVNSRHLSYADIYYNSPAYLHAILVTGFSADGKQARIHDSLVVDRERYGCEAWLPADRFDAAVTDRVRTEAFDHMGYYHLFAEISPGAPPRKVRADLRRQAKEFFAQQRFLCAIGRYRELCAERFSQGENEAKRAARRLFDHINVLYLVPSLTLMLRSLAAAECGPEIVGDAEQLLATWRALAVLALKFEATLSPTVHGRIEARFSEIEERTEQLWRSLLLAQDDERPQAEGDPI
jgi:hypothetical protein